MSHKYTRVIVLHGGELSTDVAENLESKAESTSTDISSKLTLVKMDDTKAVKALATESSSTLVVFICQTVENANPPEAAGGCVTTRLQIPAGF